MRERREARRYLASTPSLQPIAGLTLPALIERKYYISSHVPCARHWVLNGHTSSYEHTRAAVRPNLPDQSPPPPWGDQGLGGGGGRVAMIDLYW
jgi:hypothetical protein